MSESQDNEQRTTGNISVQTEQEEKALVITPLSQALSGIADQQQAVFKELARVANQFNKLAALQQQREAQYARIAVTGKLCQEELWTGISRAVISHQQAMNKVLAGLSGMNGMARALFGISEQQRTLAATLSGFKLFGENLLSSQFIANLGKLPSMWEEAGRQLAENLKQFDKDQDRFELVMVELGWPPYGMDLTPREMHAIIGVRDSYGVEQAREFVERLFIEHFDHNFLAAMLQKWESAQWLRGRLPILREVMQAHNEGKYWSSVPTLLPQIEGIIAEGYRHNGHMSVAELKSYYDKTLQKTGRYSFDQGIKKFLLEYVLVHFEHGKPLESPLSRHAILHGADTDYGTEANSLKCLLLFDFLQDKFGVVSFGKGEAFHTLFCSVVARHSTPEPLQDYVVYECPEDAERAGKRACKRCNPPNMPL